MRFASAVPGAVRNGKGEEDGRGRCTGGMVRAGSGTGLRKIRGAGFRNGKTILSFQEEKKMKSTVLLTFAAAVGALSLSAGSVRVDLNGVKDGVTLQKGASEGFTGGRASWEPKENQDKTLFLQKAVGAEYQECVFSFTPDKDGTVWFTICGNWAKEAADRPFVLIDDITVNGELLPNGDFEKTAEGKVPDWGVKGKPTFSTEARSGSNALRINHDNRIAQALKVEAGRNYTVKFAAKEAK